MTNYHVIIECYGDDEDRIPITFKDGKNENTIIAQFSSDYVNENTDYLLNHDNIPNIVDDVEDIYGFILFWPTNTLYIVHIEKNELVKTELCTIKSKSSENNMKHLFKELKNIVINRYPLCVVYKDFTIETFHEVCTNIFIAVISNIFSLWFEFEIVEDDICKFKSNYRSLKVSIKEIFDMISRITNISKTVFNLLEEIEKSCDKIKFNGFFDTKQSFHELFYSKLAIIESIIRYLLLKDE